MVILRTSLATLVLLAMAGLAYGQQKGDCCGKDKGPCPNGCGLKTCCGETACCAKGCGTKQYMKDCYKCVCTNVCLPTRPCCPLIDPSCGCDKGKGKGACDRKGGCDRCSGDKKGNGVTCTTKDGPLCNLLDHGKGCGKGCGDKGCCDPKGTCDPCGKGKGDGGCAKGLVGLLGGLLPNIPECCSCDPKIKKHLMVKEVVAVEKAVPTCNSAKGCGGEKVDGKAKGDAEAAPDVPAPPPVRIGAVRAPVVTPASYTGGAALGSMFQ